ncbi:hypothetical protein WOLCODRAFT_137774 [Wolfiporia cocos MD-104 SS10]|uniref:Uncharacterized protein n=1 Tax=Wolfiporia cocos (strain MD-104) TaxID=742152 RepID=A0A2H3JJ79_WOLCO|nr:hypothetical protein WOLCODRAFT_137774 [Wolfiporia cocos MD-104 SS10]
MNSLWNFLDWILPSIRLADDLDDPHALSDDGYSATSSLPRIRDQYTHDLRREWAREQERERERLREREKERQRIVALERDNAALRQKVASLENDLQSTRRSLAMHTLLSTPTPAPGSPTRSSQSHHIPALDPVDLQTSYESLLSAYQLTRRALQERNEEVASLKSFLSKNDEWSGAQLIQALRDLNSEIVQLAASVADEFSPVLDRRVDLTRQSDRELVNGALGPVMLNLLVTRDHTADPTLVQFAIQAWEIFCIGRVLDAFCFGLPAEVDNFLTGVFEHMHHIEQQPTTSRWRALTYTHARALLVAQGAPSPFHKLTETNIRGLLAILVLSGCTDSRGLHREPLRARFGGALARIGERAERIAGAVREGVMSGAFEVAWVPARGVGARRERESGRESWYDPGAVDNVYEGHGSEHSRVLCTVEFGLACVRQAEWAAPDPEVQEELPEDLRTKSSDRASPSDNSNRTVHPKSGSLTRSLLLKPKVLLESVAEIL